MSNLGVWVPNTRSENLKKDCVSLETNQLSRQINNPFLKNILISENKVFFKTMLKAKDDGLTMINLYSLLQNRSLLKANNAASNIEQVLEVASHKAAAVRTLTTHHENYPS